MVNDEDLVRERILRIAAQNEVEKLERLLKWLSENKIMYSAEIGRAFDFGMYYADSLHE